MREPTDSAHPPDIETGSSMARMMFEDAQKNQFWSAHSAFSRWIEYWHAF